MPVNAGAAAGVNVERPQRASAICRSWAEQLLAVAAAEQDDEALQVAAQLGQAVGGVADELFHGGAKAGGVAGQRR